MNEVLAEQPQRQWLNSSELTFSEITARCDTDLIEMNTYIKYYIHNRIFSLLLITLQALCDCV